MLIGPTGIEITFLVVAVIALAFSVVTVRRSRSKLRDAEERCSATQASLDIAKRNLDTFSDYVVRTCYPNAAIISHGWHYCTACSHTLVLSNGPKGKQTCPGCNALIKGIFVPSHKLGSNEDAYYARQLPVAYGLPFLGYGRGALDGSHRGSGAFVSRMVDLTAIDSDQAEARQES